MNKVFLLICIAFLTFVLCSCFNSDNKVSSVTDDLGRIIEIKDFNKIICVGDTLSLYSIFQHPEKLVAIDLSDNYYITDIVMPYTEVVKTANPSLPTELFIDNDLLNESLLSKYNPDLIIVPSIFDATYINEVEKRLNITICALTQDSISSSFTKTLNSIRTLGTLLNMNTRSDEVVDKLSKVINDLDNIIGTVTPLNIQLYYGCYSASSLSGILSNGNYHVFEYLKLKLDNTTYNTLSELQKSSVKKIFIDARGYKELYNEYLISDNATILNAIFAFKNELVYQLVPCYDEHNIELNLLNAYFIGKVCYPYNFKDVSIDTIFKSLFKTLYNIDYNTYNLNYNYGVQKLDLEKSFPKYEHDDFLPWIR